METYKNKGMMRRRRSLEIQKKSGRIDKFYTFNKKNEAFQALLDEEYERIKNGEEPLADEKLAFARRDSVSKEAVLDRILEKTDGELPVSQKRGGSPAAVKFDRRHLGTDARLCNYCRSSIFLAGLDKKE